MSAAFRRRQRGGPTGRLVLEWQRAGIGRYYRALLEPTPANAKMIRRLHEMFNVLAETDRGRLLIRGMIGPKPTGQRRRSAQALAVCLHPLDVWERFKHSRLQDLPTVDELLPLRPALTVWKDQTKGADLKKARVQVIGALELEESHKLTDLPDLVMAAMARKVETPAMANRIREQGLAFARATQGEMSPIVVKLRAIDELHQTTDQRRPKVHLTPAEFWALADSELGQLWPIFRDMTFTGMIQKEFWGEGKDAWRIEGLGLWVAGTKTDYRPRWVPLIQPIERPCGTQDQLMAACRKVAKRWPGFRPYTARHTFSRWLEEAGTIPPWRQSVYMGHSTKEMARRGIAVSQTMDYQTGDVSRYLAGDVAALRAFIGLPPLPANLEKLA